MTALNIIVIANYPLEKHYILASLVKGRWIDGKAQALILLLSACDMSNIFMLQTFLPSRRRDCLITIPRLHQPSQSRTIPCSAPRPCLPSKKGRWIAGKAQTVALLRFACDTPAFFNLPNLSAVKTEGLHSVSTIILIGGT